MTSRHYRDTFDYLLSEIAAKDSWWHTLFLCFFYGRKRADRIRVLERERLFWLRESLEYHALRVASRGEHDAETYERANTSFLFCKNRHMLVCDELRISYL